MTRRAAAHVFTARPTLEGAGVSLKRAFGFGAEKLFDPFLMLDDFRSDSPDKWRAGFPWHPHRGIETITYVLSGDVEHADSLGNRGVIGTGDVQWMTAGSGIIHQEMPLGDDRGRMYGFQLWANLPASEKMCDPSYRGLTDCDIPQVTTADGCCIRVIAGEVDGVRGPVEGIVIDPQYLDVTVPPGSRFVHAVEPGHTVFTYVVEGAGDFAPEAPVTDGTVVLYGDGETVEVTTGAQHARFLLLAGKPLREAIAWRGPIVMNTDEELRTAFREYSDGTFVKVGAHVGA
jgi:redox-sensitive bicupin YhaK (pirin superfamily)